MSDTDNLSESRINRHKLPLDIAVELLLACQDFKTMFSLAMVSRLFALALQSSSSSIHETIARRTFPKRAFELLNMWRIGGMTDFQRKMLKQSIRGRIALGDADESLNPSKDSIGVPEVKRLFRDRKAIYTMVAFLVGYHNDDTSEDDISRTRCIDEDRLYDLYRNRLGSTLPKDLDRPREVFAGYYAYIYLFTAVYPSKDHSMLRGIFDYSILFRLTREEASGIGLLSGWDQSILDFSTMKRQFNVPFPFYIRKWNIENLDSLPQGARHAVISGNWYSHLYPAEIFSEGKYRHITVRQGSFSLDPGAVPVAFILSMP
jgi:hypothetical protein